MGTVTAPKILLISDPTALDAGIKPEANIANNANQGTLVTQEMGEPVRVSYNF